MGSRLVRIGSNGRIVVPPEYRKFLDICEGDVLLVRLVEGELRISTADGAIKHAQAQARHYVPEGTSLADELIQERRETANKEE